MKIVLLLAFSLTLTGVTLVASADSASACTPPNCGGYACKLRYETIAFSDPFPVEDQRVPTGMDCYY